MKLKNSIIIALLLLLAWGCKQGQKQEKQFKGRVILHDNFSTFTDCSTGKEYWLEDKTGKLAAQYQQIATQPYQQVFVVFEADLLPSATTGAAAAYDNIISVKKLVSVGKGDEGACNIKNNKPVFECEGETPGKWAINFDTLNIIFTSNYPNDTVVFFPLAEADVRDTTGAGKLFYFNVGNENFQDIELIITEKPCQNKNVMSHFSSKVLFGGNSYEGCAKMKTIIKK